MLCLFATIPCEQQNLQDPDILHQLLQQISAQDPDSLAELYRRTRTAVYAFALSYLKMDKMPRMLHKTPLYAFGKMPTAISGKAIPSAGF